jgi:hypothetical protein
MIYTQILNNKARPVCVASEETLEEEWTETKDGDGGGSYRDIGMLVHRTGRLARPAVAAIKARASRSAPESKESLMISHIVDLQMFEASRWAIIARKPKSILCRGSWHF